MALIPNPFCVKETQVENWTKNNKAQREGEREREREKKKKKKQKTDWEIDKKKN